MLWPRKRENNKIIKTIPWRTIIAIKFREGEKVSPKEKKKKKKETRYWFYSSEKKPSVLSSSEVGFVYRYVLLPLLIILSESFKNGGYTSIAKYKTFGSW